MSTQPLRHEGFAQAPTLQRLLNLSPFDQLKAGRRSPTRRTPKPASEPQFADRDGARDHGQGGSIDRLGPAAGLTGDAQQQTMPPSGLHRHEARGRRRPKRPVHLEPKLERGRRNRSLGLISIVGVGDARHSMPALASEPVGWPAGRPIRRCAEDRTRIHQDRMITQRTVAPHDQTPPDLGNHVFSRRSPLTLYHHGPLQPANRPGFALGAAADGDKPEVLAMFQYLCAGPLRAHQP